MESYTIIIILADQWVGKGRLEMMCSDFLVMVVNYVGCLQQSNVKIVNGLSWPQRGGSIF